MLTPTERERLAARWLGEALRETAVLVLVFVPLDWMLGDHLNKGPVALSAFGLSIGLFFAGARIGFHGESE